MIIFYETWKIQRTGRFAAHYVLISDYCRVYVAAIVDKLIVFPHIKCRFVITLCALRVPMNIAHICMLNMLLVANHVKISIEEFAKKAPAYVIEIFYLAAVRYRLEKNSARDAFFSFR